MKAGADAIYKAWTEAFDSWFAQPGEVFMTAEVDVPFFFYTRHDWGRHQHYGRFLELRRNELIEMAWVTGHGGTFGAETVVRVEISLREGQTLVRLTHSNFDSKEAKDAHAANWPEALNTLDDSLSKNGSS